MFWGERIWPPLSKHAEDSTGLSFLQISEASASYNEHGGWVSWSIHLANVTNHSITPSHTSTTSILEKMQRQLRQPCLAVGGLALYPCSVLENHLPLSHAGEGQISGGRSACQGFGEWFCFQELWNLQCLPTAFCHVLGGFVGRASSWYGLLFLRWRVESQRQQVLGFWGLGVAFRKVQNAQFGDSAVDDVMMFVYD